MNLSVDVKDGHQELQGIEKEPYLLMEEGALRLLLPTLFSIIMGFGTQKGSLDPPDLTHNAPSVPNTPLLAILPALGSRLKMPLNLIK